MEGIGILHQKLAGAHDAEPRTDLVTELGLYLVVVDRQLLVAAQFATCDVGDDFLVCWPEAEFPPVTVMDAQQFRPVLLPAAGFLPQLSRLHRGHQKFQRAGAVHFIAYDGLDLAQHAQAKRQPAVDPCGLLADHTGAQHQLVADDLGVGRGFFQGAKRKLGKAHDQ